MNFSIYNPDKVNIVIIPHSKGGVKTEGDDALRENESYCERLRSHNIELRDNVVIIDGVHSGVGILALIDALHCFDRKLKIRKYAINAVDGVSKIPVDKEFILPCEPKFSDTFPRLIVSYHPRDFNNDSKFITSLQTDNNPIAEMIIDIANQYPTTKVEDTEWYKLNNEITEEIAILKKENEIKQLANKQRLAKKELEELKLLQKSKETFEVTVINKGEYNLYECPLCTMKNIRRTEFSHKFTCENNGKIPILPTSK
jgi:hypothetical protein